MCWALTVLQLTACSKSECLVGASNNRVAERRSRSANVCMTIRDARGVFCVMEVRVPKEIHIASI
jgi:hypothetical protein